MKIFTVLILLLSVSCTVVLNPGDEPDRKHGPQIDKPLSGEVGTVAEKVGTTGEKIGEE